MGTKTNIRVGTIMDLSAIIKQSIDTRLNNTALIVAENKPPSGNFTISQTDTAGLLEKITPFFRGLTNENVIIVPVEELNSSKPTNSATARRKM